LQKQIETLSATLAEHQSQLAELDAQREQADAGMACDVLQVVGGVAVQTIVVPPDLPVLAEIEIKKLRHVLRDTRQVKSRLFHGETGRFSWTPPAKKGE
jgi:hypothetical protein